MTHKPVVVFENKMQDHHTMSENDHPRSCFSPALPLSAIAIPKSPSSSSFPPCFSDTQHHQRTAPLTSTQRKEKGQRENSREGSISPPPLLLRRKGKEKINQSALDLDLLLGSDPGSGSMVQGESKREKKVEDEDEQHKLKLKLGKSERDLPPSRERGLRNDKMGFASSHPLPPMVPSSGPTFLNPTVKKTWAYGYSRDDGEDITIEEVLQHDHNDNNGLSLAVVSSFQWGLEWFYGKVGFDSGSEESGSRGIDSANAKTEDTQTTKVILIVGAKEDLLKRRWRFEESRMPHHLRICFAPMDNSVQIMHAKLMLLFHPTYLRIVVTSANLTPYDWGETGVMENMVFLIDLPRMLSENGNVNVNSAEAEKPRELKQMRTSFQINLMRFLDAVGLDEQIIQSIFDFDFTRTKDIAFVHSIGGVHVGQDEPWRQTGFCGLGLAIQELGLETLNGSPVSVDYVTSSLGSTRPDFLQTLYMACQGDDGLTTYCWQHNITKSGEKLNGQVKFEAERLVYDNIYANLRIYYPLHETVENSRGGIASGGTVCFNGDFKSYSDRVKDVMRDCQSHRSGLLMHNKLIFVRRLGHLEKSSPGWFYVGSANCSQSAWGKMTKDRQLGLPKLTCRNWECGVVIPMKKAVSISKRMDGSSDQNSDIRGISMSDGIIPVPMQLAGMRYRGRNPWGQR